MEPQTSTESARSVDALTTMVRTALGLAQDLIAEPDLARLLHALRCVPATERRSLMAMLEREVAARRCSRATGDDTVGPPDPLARIFFRVIDRARPVPAVGRDDLVRSTLHTAATLIHFPEALRTAILTKLAAAACAIEPAAREAMLRHNRDVRALLEVTARE